tara:strand:+ start:38 stop:898 length:861 start_codon:yes stop_codon:yes gene_type:complete
MVTKEEKPWSPRSRASSFYGDPKATSPYPLSRSKLENSYRCPRCFWIDRVAGMAFSDMVRMNLNLQIDAILKDEFDACRGVGPHPYMTANGLGHMMPLDHPEIDNWRNNAKGISTVRNDIKYRGSVDDMWVSNLGTEDELWHVVDYKSTATNEDLTLDLCLEDIYKQAIVRQLAIYQWLFREAGYPISTVGYFVYENADKTATELLNNGSNAGPNTVRGLPFREVTVIEVDTADPNIVIDGERINFDWVEGIADEAHRILNLKSPPPPNPLCKFCAASTAIRSAFP